MVVLLGGVVFIAIRDVAVVKRLMGVVLAWRMCSNVITRSLVNCTL